MNTPQLTASEIGRRGRELYDQSIRQFVEPEHRGKFLVLDIDSGAYEIDADEMKAFDRAIARNPAGNRYLLRIGQSSAHRIGGHINRAGV